VAYLCHESGTSCTTVDERLLTLLGDALGRNGRRAPGRSPQSIPWPTAVNGDDASYAAYDEHPIDERDEWVTSPRSGQPPPQHDAPAGSGEVWWCELPEIGRRPVVVLSGTRRSRGCAEP